MPAQPSADFKLTHYRLIILVGISSAVACGVTPSHAAARYHGGSGPTVEVLDSVELHDPGEPYLRRPIGVSISWTRRSYYVADLFGGHALRYDRDGVRRNVYAGIGTDTGAMKQLMGVFLVDSSIALVDGIARAVKLYDPASGRLLGAQPFTGDASWYIAPARDTVWMGVMDTIHRTAALLWDPRTRVVGELYRFRCSISSIPASASSSRFRS